MSRRRRQPELLRRLRAAGLAEAVFCRPAIAASVAGRGLGRGDQAAAAVGGLCRPGRGSAAGGRGPVPTVCAAAEALRHIFAVAASLESQVIGEPQVLGQVKEAHRLSDRAGLMGGSSMRRCRPPMPRPSGCAARRPRRAAGVHRRRGGGACPPAPWRSAPARGGLLIGPGEMGELVIEQLRRAGLGGLTVVHASPRRAALIAKRHEAHH